MRIAVIACSSYSAREKLSELPNVETDVDLLGQRLSEPDAGFVVHSFRAERGLAEAVEQVLAEAPEPVEELLFFFAGYAVLNDERGPALLLDGERLSAYSLKRLRRVLAEGARASLAVLDTVPAFDGQMSPRDAVMALGSALTDPSSGVHLLASSRPESAAFGRSPFSSLFELVLDWQSVSGSPVRVESLYAAMRAEESLFSAVPAAEYFPGSAPFELLRPAPTPTWSEAPPSVTETPSNERESEPEAPLSPEEFTPTKPRIEALSEPPPSQPPSEPTIVDRAPQEPALAESAPEAPALAESVPEIPAAPAVPTFPAFPAVAEAPPQTPPATEPTPSQATPPVPTEAVKKSIPPPLPKRKPKTPAPPAAPKAPPTPAELRQLALERLTACMADGRHVEAVEHARAALRWEPRDGETYRALNMLFEKLGRPDGCWNVACVLDASGMADVNESLLASLHRPEGLIAAQGVLGDEDWRKRSLYPEREPAFDALFAALGNASVEVGAETARRKRRIPALDPATEQDPAKSTTTLARTLVWSARLLGVPTPALHIVDAAAGELLAAPTVVLTALASKSLGSGLSLPELAFLWARRLVLFRPEHRIVSFLPNAAELEDFVSAAHVLGAGSERAFKRLEGDTKLFARGLKRHLRGVDRGPLEAAAKAIAKESIASSVTAFRRSIELAGGRAGLLASGDLSLALRMTERFPQHGVLSLDEQTMDLLLYSVSDEYAALRERLGVAVRA